MRKLRFREIKEVAGELTVTQLAKFCLCDYGLLSFKVCASYWKLNLIVFQTSFDGGLATCQVCYCASHVSPVQSYYNLMK